VGLTPADYPRWNESVDRFTVNEELAGRRDDYRS
jgi:hypothetical protein